MVDVRGDVLRPPHGTTPAAVNANKNQKFTLALKLKLDQMSHLSQEKQ